MACTFDYSTGQITLDFHLVKEDEVCRLRGVPSYVGGHGCLRCPFNGGWYITIEHGAFLKCKHMEAKDTGEGVQIEKYKLCEEFKREAMIHFYD